MGSREMSGNFTNGGRWQLKNFPPPIDFSLNIITEIQLKDTETKQRFATLSTQYEQKKHKKLKKKL